MGLKFKITIIFFFIGVSSILAQDVEIYLDNPSFEDTPRKGENYHPIKGWMDCGRIYFRSETPPDIHPVDYWEVTKMPSQGETYLGMVVRENESWEFISQRLSEELQAGKCYSFSIDLARSETYLSPTRRNRDVRENFTEPAVLRIWGGNNGCSKKELLAESRAVTNFQWQTYNFKIRPNRNQRYIILEAFYKTPVLIPYNGHVLADNASTIKQIPCSTQLVAIEEPKEEEIEEIPVTIEKKAIVKSAVPPPVKAEPEVEKEKILDELNTNRLKEGQTIRIENLFFAPDSSSIGDDSFDVLNEIFDFLIKNKNIVVEIGGHTNGLPKHEYCDNLSSARAKEVALYLVRKGVPAQRLKFKGYGKRKPIASNHTKMGRHKNQRVEIKILSLDG